MEPIYQLMEPRDAFNKTAELYCGKFDVDKENQRIVEKIIQYIARDPEFNSQSDMGFLDLNKGIMLIGNPGSGKTTLIEIIQALFRKTPLSFRKRSTAEITDQFAKDGPEFLKTMTGNIFFDDLGFERTAVHFGDKRELMQDVIFSRYDQMRYDGSVSHFTSMCGFDDIRQRYGLFAWSRLKQMCNIFVLGGQDGSKDRRTGSIVVQRPPIEKMPRLWVSKSEYDEAMELKKIREWYKKEAEKPREPVQAKGSGTRLREYWDRITS